MDAGCSKHGCWYASEGYDDCYDSDDGRCILGFAVSRPKYPGYDLSRCVTLTTAGRIEIAADQLASGGIIEGHWNPGSPWQPWHLFQYGLFSTRPPVVVSGQAFELWYRPYPGRGLVYREQNDPPAGVRLEAQEGYPDPLDGDMWHCPQGTWLFHAGQWRQVHGFGIDIVYEPLEVVDVDGFLLPRPASDNTVKITGRWA